MLVRLPSILRQDEPAVILPSGNDPVQKRTQTESSRADQRHPRTIGLEGEELEERGTEPERPSENAGTQPGNRHAKAIRRTTLVSLESCFRNFGAHSVYAVRNRLRLPDYGEAIDSVIDSQHCGASDTNLGHTPILLRQPHAIRL